MRVSVDNLSVGILTSREQLSIKVLSEGLGLSHAKMRRCVKEILPVDPNVSEQGSGKTRMLSLNQSFRVYLYYQIINSIGLKRKQAACVLDMIEPWLLEMGLYPKKTWRYKPDRIHRKVTNWTIYIYEHANQEAFSFGYRGIIRKGIDPDLSKRFKKNIFKACYVSKNIINEFEIGRIKDMSDVIGIKVLDITLLKLNFMPIMFYNK